MTDAHKTRLFVKESSGLLFIYIEVSFYLYSLKWYCTPFPYKSGEERNNPCVSDDKHSLPTF